MVSHKQIVLNPGLFLAILLSACTLPTGTPVLDEPPRVFELYVSTSGNDRNDCLSEAAACQYASTALTRSTPGSTIHFGPGEFLLHSPLGPRYDLSILGAGVERTTLIGESSDVIQLAYPSRIVIRDLTITGRGTISAGNGIEVRAGVTLTLENCRIHDKYWGLRLLGGRVLVNNCSFENNYYGLDNWGDLALAASTFGGNRLALTNQGTAQVEDTAFGRNGIFDAASSAASTAVTNSGTGALTIQGGNISDSQGYALVVDGGSVTLESVEVRDNAGMAVWHQQGSLTILSSVISDNGGYGVAVGGRGGVADVGRVDIIQSALLRNGSAGLRIDGGEIHVQNSTISGNIASSSGGGGIWGYGGNLLLLDSTVAYNTGHGLQLGTAGGADPGVITVRRSVIALNSGDECQLDPRTTLSSGVFARYVCDDSWTAGTLKLRPLAAEAGTYVHPIDADSPLVDAGGPLATCPSVDQRNFSRPSGGTCDVGAYEYGSVSSAAAIVIATAGTPDVIPIPSSASPSVSMNLILNRNANCREGPGSGYDAIDAYPAGQSLVVDGRNEDVPWWWQVQMPGSTKHCWISSVAGMPQGDFNLLPVTAQATEVPGSAVVDNDGDGYPAGPDCNDNDPKINPGAAETPSDKVDSNCNGDDNK